MKETLSTSYARPLSLLPVGRWASQPIVRRTSPLLVAPSPCCAGCACASVNASARAPWCKCVCVLECACAAARSLPAPRAQKRGFHGAIAADSPPSATCRKRRQWQKPPLGFPRMQVLSYGKGQQSEEPDPRKTVKATWSHLAGIVPAGRKSSYDRLFLQRHQVTSKRVPASPSFLMILFLVSYLHCRVLYLLMF